jgi:hypothetical protein
MRLCESEPRTRPIRTPDASPGTDRRGSGPAPGDVYTGRSGNEFGSATRVAVSVCRPSVVRGRPLAGDSFVSNPERALGVPLDPIGN